eukprot:5915651-Pleurochrysis_carterae.AAC.2
MAAFDHYKVRAVKSLAAVRANVAKTKSAAEQHQFHARADRDACARSGAVRARHLHVIGGHAALKRGAFHGARQRAQGKRRNCEPTARCRRRRCRRLGSPTADAEELMTIEAIHADKLRSAASAARGERRAARYRHSAGPPAKRATAA